MVKSVFRFVSLCLVMSVTGLACSNSSSSSGRNNAEVLVAEARSALGELYKSTPAAEALGREARGILVFPSITKAGLLVGGQYGKGVLFKDGKAVGFYSSVAASYGLQAGAQTFGYAMLFMGENDIKYLDKSDGWEVGVGPTVTVVDKGMAHSLTTTTLREGVYAFFFEQRGLMAGIGIQGTKISRTEP